jgi:hypothetical protein
MAKNGDVIEVKGRKFVVEFVDKNGRPDVVKTLDGKPGAEKDEASQKEFWDAVDSAVQP